MGSHKHLGPDHSGRLGRDTNPIRSLNRSHTPTVEVPARHGGKPNIARDASRGKAAFDLKIHGGMQTQSKNGAAFGGDHKSALDSLSGQAVVPGKPTNAPGWGNAGARSGHPLTKPPGATNLKPVLPVPGQRSRANDGFVGHVAGGKSRDHERAMGRAGKDHAERTALGQRIIGEALEGSAPDDRKSWGLRHGA